MPGYYDPKMDLNKPPVGLQSASKPVLDDKNTYGYYPNYDYRKAGVLSNASPFLTTNQYAHQPMPGQSPYPPNLQPPNQPYQSGDNYQVCTSLGF